MLPLQNFCQIITEGRYNMQDSYRTVYEKCVDEIEEKKSRFIASLCPVQTEEQAVEFINSVKSANRKARHNVYAYILREGNTMRYSDDGEPQGTGGVPTLETLRSAGLTDVCVVVTRYFGGILLGTGGLARAYSGACKKAIERARIMEICRCSKFTIRCDYSLYGRLPSVITGHEGKTVGEDFGESVTLDVIIKSEFAAAFRDSVTDAAHGRVEIEETVDLYEDFA